MKLPILGDTHWGCRSDSPLFYKHFERFYGKFVDDCVKADHKTILQVGDLFDVRKKTNMVTFQESRRILFDPLKEAGIALYVIVGNHDSYYKESIKINTPRLLLSEFEYSNIIVVDSPMTVDFGGVPIDLIPWICKENEEEIMRFVEASTSSICAGHFEFAGFAMYRGMESPHGLDASLFKKYKRVLSGHYHHRSTKGNVTYVGTPYEMTWQDYGDPKGHHVYDTKADTLTFHENPDKIFVKLTYDETAALPESGDLSDKFVKVLALNKSDPVKYDSFMRPIIESAYSVETIEDTRLDSGVSTEELIQMKDTISVMNSYVDSTDTPVDKAALKALLNEVYIEAINEEAA